MFNYSDAHHFFQSASSLGEHYKRGPPNPARIFTFSSYLAGRLFFTRWPKLASISETQPPEPAQTSTESNRIRQKLLSLGAPVCALCSVPKNFLTAAALLALR